MEGRIYGRDTKKKRNNFDRHQAKIVHPTN